MQNTSKFCIFLATTLLLAINVKEGAAFGAELNNDAKGQWRQWRGPEGLGVSYERNLPESWDSNSQNIEWKVRIPGEGISSPVVSNGRVFLTTAYESSKSIILRKFVGMSSFGLAAALSIAAIVSFLRKRPEEIQKKIPHQKPGPAGWFNRLFTGITSFCFVCVALVAINRPQYLDSVFGKFDFLKSNLTGHQSQLLSMAEGAPAAVWLTSGAIALLGLAVAVGCFKEQSIWRLAGAFIVFFSACLLVKFTPLDQWKLKIDLYKRLIFSLPGVLIASWHIFNYWKIRQKKGMERHFGGLQVSLLILLIIGLSALVFVPPNFMQSARGLQRVVVCLDQKNGSILWEQPVFTAPAERKHSENTYATPTPATDGKHIIANFGLGIACLDFDGRILWHNRDKGYFENSRYGAVSSPVLSDDTVIVVQEREDYSKRPSWIAAFDRETGQTLWKINPVNIRGCYTTPLVYQDNNNMQLIISSLENVVSYDIQSGEYLWTQEIPTRQLVAGMAGSEEFLCIGGGTHGPRATVMMRLSGKGKDTKVDVLWQSNRGAPGNSSPVIYDDKLFTVSDNGAMTCYDLLSGKVLWSKRLSGRFFSSLVAGDGKVYATNTKGVTTVLSSDSRLKVLAENDLQGRCYASAAISNGRILIRIADYLYCIEKARQ